MKKINLYHIFLMLALVLIGTGRTIAQNYTWVKKADLPDPNYQGASFTIGTKVYVVGGVIDHINTPVNLNRHVWEYDATTDTWTQKHDAPGTAVFGASSFVIGSYAYIVNGWDSTNSGHGPADCWRYDPAADAWALMAPFPRTGRYTCAAFAISGKGYVTCGFSPYTNETWQYDPTTNAWTQKTSFPGVPRQSTTWFTIGNYGYVGMGYPQSSGWAYFASDFYRYDPSTDVWLQLNDFPGQPIVGESTFVLDGDAYLVCNVNENQYNFSNGASRDIWKYNPTGDSWTYWGIFPDTGIVGGNHVTCNGAGFIGMGEHYVYGTYSRVWWSFGPATGAYSCAATISKFAVNNATYNFQANGSFSPAAQLTWDFGDGHTGTGTSVIHSYAAIGTYGVSLTVQDSGTICTYTALDTAVITNLSNCSVVAGSVHIGQQYTLYASPSGGGPFTYAWSSPTDSSFSSTSPDPIVVLPANVPVTYCVTITDTTGCSASSCTTITYVPSLDSCETSLYIYPSNVPGLYYGYVYHTGATPVSYSWSFGNGVTSVDSFPTYVYPTAGYFDICLTITDANGCVSGFCDSLFYAFKAGGGPIHELNILQKNPLGIGTIDAPKVAVYPNPANSEVEISAGGKQADQVTIYSINGQKISTTDKPLRNKLDVSSLTAGIYFLELKINGQTSRVKLTKTE